MLGARLGVIALSGALSNPDFVSTWDTTQAGSASDTVELPLLSGGTYSGTIDWGDGNSDALSYANRTHVYASSGTYTITISGTIEGWQFLSGDSDKIIDISNWGTLTITTNNAFISCSNLDISATDSPVISTVNMSRAFYNCGSLTNIDLSSWDVGSVEIFSSFFHICRNLSGANIGNWDMSSATNTNSMFEDCDVYDENLGLWDVSNITSSQNMFKDCFAFNNGGSDSINNWNTSNFQIINSMFREAHSFNQPLNNWDVSNVTTMSSVFRLNTGFDQSLSDWDISSVTSLSLFLQNGTLSTANYDATLIGWEATLQAAYPSGVGYPYTININFGSSQFTSGGAGETAKNSLLTTFGWTITDGGGV